ncbi:hypothetical protein KFY57_28705, partial [Salmonella enterica subsp. enterica serovar Typhimurium]|nr:hypothetical protein [Salmonella enterica subsp. enterica serovar Typhimurium]
MLSSESEVFFLLFVTVGETEPSLVRVDSALTVLIPPGSFVSYSFEMEIGLVVLNTWEGVSHSSVCGELVTLPTSVKSLTPKIP